jgi:hypothetical protein
LSLRAIVLTGLFLSVVSATASPPESCPDAVGEPLPSPAISAQLKQAMSAAVPGDRIHAILHVPEPDANARQAAKRRGSVRDFDRSYKSSFSGLYRALERLGLEIGMEEGTLVMIVSVEGTKAQLRAAAEMLEEYPGTILDYLGPIWFP